MFRTPDIRKIKLLGGLEITVDFSNLPVPCRKCGKRIMFGITKNSKYIPIIRVEGENGEEQWQTHFTDCEFAQEFRQPKSSLEKRIEDQEENERALNDL